MDASVPEGGSSAHKSMGGTLSSIITTGLEPDDANVFSFARRAASGDGRRHDAIDRRECKSSHPGRTSPFSQRLEEKAS